MSILRDYQNNHCYLCATLMAPQGEMFAHDDRMPSLDHVMPKSKGGPNRLGNVALAHKRCNNDKADRLPTACEVFFAQVMARCFEEAHVAEPYQGFQDPAVGDQHRQRYGLHIRGKGFMYIRGPNGGQIMSRGQYRSRLKRLAMEKMKA